MVFTIQAPFNNKIKKVNREGKNMKRFHPGYVYKITHSDTDGVLKEGDLLSVDRNGIAGVQRSVYIVLSNAEIERLKEKGLMFERTTAYKNALEKTGEHIISATDSGII